MGKYKALFSLDFNFNFQEENSRIVYVFFFGITLGYGNLILWSLNIDYPSGPRISEQFDVRKLL